MGIAVPTIGRVVYLYSLFGDDPEKPYTAFVADVGIVGNPLTINCAVLAHNGDMILGGLQGVPHKSELLGSKVFWDWMPYQKAVASGEIAPTLHAPTKEV